MLLAITHHNMDFLADQLLHHLIAPQIFASLRVRVALVHLLWHQELAVNIKVTK